MPVSSALDVGVGGALGTAGRVSSLARYQQELVVRFAGTPILVLGDVMVDEYVWGEVDRVSPEAPVPVVEVRRRTWTPGGAANVAAGIASLGGQPLLAGVVGAARGAWRLRQALVERGIGAEGLVVDEKRPTTLKTRIVAGGQQVARTDEEVRDPLPADVEEALVRWAADRIGDVAAVVISDYGKGALSPRSAGEVISLARGAGRPVIVDPKGRDFTRYRGATVVTPNLREVEVALNVGLSWDADLPMLAARLRSVLDGSAVLVTRGADGMSLFAGQDPGDQVDIAAQTRNVFDVTGAGDAVVGTLALALANDAGLERGARTANLVAGVAVGKRGADMPTLEELLGSERRPEDS